jgi:hypothetical protein
MSDTEPSSTALHIKSIQAIEIVDALQLFKFVTAYDKHTAPLLLNSTQKIPQFLFKTANLLR